MEEKLMQIELKQISKMYRDDFQEPYHALKEIDLSVPAGEFLAIVGKSGSGKTTLLHILGLVDTFDTGEYLFENVSMKKKSKSFCASYRNKKIGYIFQDFALVPKMSVFDNIAIPMYISNKSKTSIERRVRELSFDLNIISLLKKPVYQLSGGEKQRVAIARALTMKPNLLLADEPTGSLDRKNTENIIDILKKINREGTTVVLVTHDEDVASRCERIIRLEEGKICNI